MEDMTIIQKVGAGTMSNDPERILKAFAHVIVEQQRRIEALERAADADASGFPDLPGRLVVRHS